MGFVLTNDEAKAYIKERAVNGQVVLPYLNGEDINSHPEQKASRWAIDFRNKSLDECKEKWPELLERIFRLVKPQRIVPDERHIESIGGIMEISALLFMILKSSEVLWFQE